MDYIFDYLVEPVEFEIEKNIKVKPFPDKFRKYPFGIKNKLNYTQDMKIMAKITNTKEKYWDDSCDLMEKLMKMIDAYGNLNCVPLAKYIAGHQNLPDDILKYYNKIYDIADIIIAKSLINKKSDVLVNIISQLLSNCVPSLHIGYRITIYISVYFTKILMRKRKLIRFAETILTKFEEYKSDDGITKFFMIEELDEYICYINNLLTREKNRIKNKAPH
ncbi:hypothetical protein QJ856_gp0073 [Tupanvirus deep ocean]|uniref:Uncharacterized protein n=1 Tax=Tupanvirus soda lake TaxID=2126985 RepID=A0A2K9L2S8_9VIRU|nr:hypothetical protein QJ856_gp0073 [Tupanvirus deep ocean]AUL80036.2 hypothetical protein [Tupanvirus deep ocean]